LAPAAGPLAPACSFGHGSGAAWGAPVGLEEAPKGLAGDGIEGEVEFHGGGHGGRQRSKEQWRGDAHLRGGEWARFSRRPDAAT
jgi:hypothetical protein